MLFYDNLIITYNNKHIMFNLLSFRRRVLSEQEYNLVCKMVIENKKCTLPDFDVHQNSFINQLYNERQVLSEAMVDQLERELPKSIEVCNLSFPAITLELSYNCNLSCSYCYQNKFKGDSGNISMTPTQLDKVFDYVTWHYSKHGITGPLKSIVITGGEPLLDSNINTIMHLLNKKIDSALYLKTNGIGILKYKDCIDYRRFEHIQVSLDGIEEIHLSQTSDYPYNDDSIYCKIIEGIEYLLSIGVRVNIACIVNKNTYKFIPAFINYLRALNILTNANTKLFFNPVFDYEGEFELNNAFNDTMDIVDIAQFFNNHLREFKDNCLWFNGLARLKKLIFRAPNEHPEYHIGKCNPDDGIPIVFSPNGKIYFCYCTDLSKGIIGEYDDVKVFDFESYKSIAACSIHDNVACSKCIYRFVCGGGCFSNKRKCREGSYAEFCGVFANEYLMDHIGELL